ncbi:hypothetical protein CAPTEDRAFT_214277 [Capitella teleta]|uniref:Uncharacterized protein n=1 Tax=Capitella teleta TaxID=283909 RepID=R7VIC4_CAPTE|nr:hypothetical protein CAPTEDRAFT_214277 [Capitella teleta]|eukprot:ELU18593.1 hypothetical protein CAPTEDRAFT_214277 [Capitella teleta]
MTEEEEQPQQQQQQRRRRSSERSNDDASIGRGSHSTLSSPSASPLRTPNRKCKESPLLEQRRVSEEALEQGIASLKSQYGHRHVSVAYMQASDHSGAVLTISGESSPVLERSRPRGGLRGGSPGHKHRRRHSSMKQTKSSMLQASPKTTMRSLSDSGSRSSPVLPEARRHHHHHHHHHRGHHSQPTSKTALLSSNTTSVDKDRARLADHIQMEENDDDDDDGEDHRSRTRRHKSTRKRAIELAFAGCVMLLGVGALLVAFMWSGDTAWTIVGSTCMSLGALFLILGVCWYLSKARDSDQVEKLEIRVVNSNQMAQLIKQGFKVKPISAV